MWSGEMLVRLDVDLDLDLRSTRSRSGLDGFVTGG